jgi:hypothetical protein
MTINIRRATPTANAGRYYIEQVEAEMTNVITESSKSRHVLTNDSSSP